MDNKIIGDTMTPERALNGFNNLILQCMANGAIKSFEELDRMRDAHECLKKELQKVPVNRGADEISKP